VTGDEWLPFRYRGFHDVPLTIVVEVMNVVYFLHRPFDDELDEYPDNYAVYRLPAAVNLDRTDWTELAEEGIRVGQVRCEELEFDASRREAFRSHVLERLLKGH
jgi:hypothetical protein